MGSFCSSGSSVCHVGSAVLSQRLVGRTLALISPLPKWLVQVWCMFDAGLKVVARLSQESKCSGKLR